MAAEMLYPLINGLMAERVDVCIDGQCVTTVQGARTWIDRRDGEIVRMVEFRLCGVFQGQELQIDFEAMVAHKTKATIVLRLGEQDTYLHPDAGGLGTRAGVRAEEMPLETTTHGLIEHAEFFHDYDKRPVLAQGSMMNGKPCLVFESAGSSRVQQLVRFCGSYAPFRLKA